MACTAFIVGACGDDGFEPALQYRMIGLPAATDGACPAQVAEAAPAFAAATHARLTYVDAGTAELRCDLVLDLAAPASVIAVPDVASPVDLIVEYLDDTGAVVGRGDARGIDLASSGVVDIRVLRAGAFACAPERGLAPRAFHSATPLPGGEVLLVGGIVDAGGDPAGGFFLQPAAEIYTPSTGRSRVATIPSLVPRAFHQTYVLGGDGAPPTPATVGAAPPTGDPASTPVAEVGGAVRLGVTASATPAPTEILTYTAADSSFTRMTIDPDVTGRAFAALPAPGALALAIVGGVDGGGGPVGSAERIDTVTGLPAGSTALRRTRIGASATALNTDQILVWGGDPTAGDGTGTAELGELLVGWRDAPAVQALTLDAAGETAPQRAFHAAALAGDGAVILVGGFVVNVGMALTPTNRVIQRIRNPAGSLLLDTVGNETVAAPHGYGAAVTTGDGDVVGAGGNPDPALAGCATDHQGLVCAIGDAWRYDAAAAALAPTGPLGVPRYGHALTLLDDGTVAATGGFTVRNGALEAVVDVELYEPRGTSDDPLAPGILREPGDVARTALGEPLAPCGVVARYEDAGLVAPD